jgi:hypothetical protein
LGLEEEEEEEEEKQGEDQGKERLSWHRRE